ACVDLRRNAHWFWTGIGTLPCLCRRDSGHDRCNGQHSHHRDSGDCDRSSPSREPQAPRFALPIRVLIMNTGKRNSRRYSYRWFAMAIFCAVGCLPLAQASASGTTPDKLAVGMHYVVAPFVGGSKVRTPEAPETAMAEALASRMGVELRAVQLNEARA